MLSDIQCGYLPYTANLTSVCLLALVGGNGGSALCLQADLTEGYTERCDTFESPPLCRGRFKIQFLEVWGIQRT